MAQEIGFIGLGMMGGPMVRRLISQDYKMIIHDVRPEVVAEYKDLGADAELSPQAVASRVDTVFVSLPTPNVVKQVALGEHGVFGGTKVKTFVDLSTTGPNVAREVAAGLKAKGIIAIDAPVSGGVTGAVAGTLAVMMSGPKALCDELTPTLRIIGKNVFYIGTEPGMGQMMKLVNNYLSATALAATSEAVVLGTKFGLDPKLMIEVINVSSGRNSATLDKFPRSILTRKFDGGFKAALLHKDVRLCMEQAEQLGMPMWIGQMVRQLWAYAEHQGGGADEAVEIIKHMEKWAGVQVGPVK